MLADCLADILDNDEDGSDGDHRRAAANPSPQPNVQKRKKKTNKLKINNAKKNVPKETIAPRIEHTNEHKHTHTLSGND